MEGHYHLEMAIADEAAESVCINEPSLDEAILEAKSTGGQLINYGFVCTFGCGLMHQLCSQDIERLRQAFPNLPVVDSAGRSLVDGKNSIATHRQRGQYHVPKKSYNWGEESIVGSKRDVEVQIQQFLAEHLCEGDCGSVIGPDGQHYNIEIIAKLVKSEDDTASDTQATDG